MRAAMSLLGVIRTSGLLPNVRTLQHNHTRLDRVEEHGSRDGLVQTDEEKQTSASNDRDIHLADLWLGSTDEIDGHGRESHARFNE